MLLQQELRDCKKSVIDVEQKNMNLMDIIDGLQNSNEGLNIQINYNN